MYIVQNVFILIYNMLYGNRYRKNYSKEGGFLNAKTD